MPVILNELRSVAMVRELSLTESSRRSVPANEITWADVIRWSELADLGVPELFDAIAKAVAQSYARGELSYVQADIILNDLYLNWVWNMQTADAIAPWPPLFHEIYLAFDDGEYPHVATPDHDPVADRTNPTIADILSRLNA